MSRTLFWYILRDLLRIFFMTSGVLAGIMAFGGLLRPLTEHGLSAMQVGRMLMYMMPATQTYSLPVAALFATTVVYGRLAADNELTACRATGISYLALAAPALILGLVLAIVSLLCLCFVVPHYTLKVEKVIFTNIAEVVQKSITRTHRLRVGQFTIFAQSASIPEEAREGGEQVVVLGNPMFITYDGNDARRVPREFCVARSATAYIRPVGDEVEFTAVLVGGGRFPRDLKGASQGAVSIAQFGPRLVPSPIKENPKFMDIQQLKSLYTAPQRSRRVRERLGAYIQEEQEHEFLRRAMAQLNSASRACRFQSEQATMVLQRGDPPAALKGGELTVDSKAAAGTRQVKLLRLVGGEVVAEHEALQIRLRAQSDPANGRIQLEFDLFDAIIDRSGAVAPRERFRQPLNIPMPDEISAVAQTVTDRAVAKASERLRKGDPGKRERLLLELRELRNRITSEIHARASFAISCLILVMVGCALGMMFHSGNFLSAFALSVVPALVSIALVSTGQHVVEASTGSNALGLAIIWSGNIAVLALAVTLLWRLQRQ